VSGCESRSFYLALQAHIPDLTCPLDDATAPPLLAALDLLEFSHRAVAQPIELDFHSFFGHSHLRFEPIEGQKLFRDEVNRVLGRNAIAFELNADGFVLRIASEPLRQALGPALFLTGDETLNSLLETARAKFLDPDPRVRQESLEKLWDAWERLKTLEPASDKKASAKRLIDRAASDATFREALETEARELTRIGNTFQIRHSEMDKVPVKTVEQVHYLFHRLFALIELLLKMTKRIK
jgi:hypothetical protein